MKKPLLLCILAIAYLMMISCRGNTGSTFEEKEISSVENTKGVTTDILEYLIKKEQYGKDSLNLLVKNIYTEGLGDDEFVLNIIGEISPDKIKYIGEYYLAFNIYPYDDEKLLKIERKKYGFENYSIKIKKTKENQLLVSRRIKTKIERARAITLVLISRKTKKKQFGWILKDVNLYTKKSN